MNTIEQEKRRVSKKKADQFKSYALKYLEARKKVPTGRTARERIAENKRRIMEQLGAAPEDWNDWHWQLKNRIDDSAALSKIVDIDAARAEELDRIGKEFRWGFTPYLASLMDPSDPNCPVMKQMLPDVLELEKTGNPDFSGEEYSSPVKNLVRWYPDRVAVHVTNLCCAFCRHCLRRRKIGEVDRPTERDNMEEIWTYLKNNPEIRDVLYTGGDPLSFSDEKLDEYLTRLDEIESVEVKRIGSRIPVVMPQRITDELCGMLSRHHPLFVNIQVNHPLEITGEMRRACAKLAAAGIPLGNQTVLMRGINDDPVTMKVLVQELLRARVRPYYIYHCQGTIGIEHFRTPVETGIEIMEHLRGFTSGMAVPTFMITPHGYGKTPLQPNYRLSSGEGYLVLRNWEGVVYEYENPLPADG